MIPQIDSDPFPIPFHIYVVLPSIPTQRCVSVLGARGVRLICDVTVQPNIVELQFDIELIRFHTMRRR